MIDFECNCVICHRPISKENKKNYPFEIDGIKLCYNHFQMALCAGLLLEGMDDEWHFININDIKLL